MYVARHRIDVVTATGGAATEYSPPINGRVGSIVYTKDGSNAFASTADFTVTNAETGESIWAQSNVNASATVRPSPAAHTATGGVSTIAQGGIYLANDRVKIAIAQGGNTKNGRFDIVVI